MYYLINQHGLRTPYTLCSEIMGEKEKVSTELWDVQMEIGTDGQMRLSDMTDTTDRQNKYFCVPDTQIKIRSHSGRRTESGK